ncbi:MAG: tetratricopeptide repeat protein [Candidatus Marinimicrobia bacterium]|nr:tetratricopeptide repeat protein [Candidatus Neomarinimicrobiota bacterium]
MSKTRTILILTLLAFAALIQGQTANGNLFYDIGLVIDDTTKQVEEPAVEATSAPSRIMQLQLELEEELNRYQQKLVETEIRLKYQTEVIDSLHEEISQIKAAGETDKALLSTRISNLVDQQEKNNDTPVFTRGESSVSDSVFAELHTPWKTTSVTKQATIPVWSGPKLTRAEEQAIYRSGLTKFHQEYYYQAIEDFNTIVQRGTDITLQANSQYWVGRCYYEKGLYDEAIKNLEQVQRFSTSDKLDDALVMIGLAFKNKDRLPEAKLAFQELVSRHPGSEYLTLAKRFVQE